MKLTTPCSEISEAIKFYLKILVEKQEIRKIKEIEVKFSDIEEQGFLSIKSFDKNGVPNGFLIEISKDQLDEPILQVIAHECVHIKQCLREEMEVIISSNGIKRYWKGVQWTPSKFQNPYFDSPWEIEAIGWEESLYNRYIK